MTLILAGDCTPCQSYCLWTIFVVTSRREVMSERSGSVKTILYMAELPLSH